MWTLPCPLWMMTIVSFIINRSNVGFVGGLRHLPRFRGVLSGTTLPCTHTDIVDVDARSNSCLDWKIIVDALIDNTVTVLGAEVCMHRSSASAEVVNMNYAMVDQLSAHLAFLPLRTSMNVWIVLNKLELNMSPPEQEDLFAFNEHIEQIMTLQEFFEFNKDSLSLFTNTTNNLLLPEDFISVMKGAFDDQGNLNAEKYPILQRLR